MVIFSNSNPSCNLKFVTQIVNRRVIVTIYDSYNSEVFELVITGDISESSIQTIGYEIQNIFNSNLNIKPICIELDCARNYIMINQKKYSGELIYFNFGI